MSSQTDCLRDSESRPFDFRGCDERAYGRSYILYFSNYEMDSAFLSGKSS